MTTPENTDLPPAPVLPEVPASLELDPMVLSLLHMASFLDASDDEVVSPDAACAVLEMVGLYVQRLDDDDLDHLEEQLAILADHAREVGWPDSAREFVEEFLENCGIVDELPEDEVGEGPQA